MDISKITDYMYIAAHPNAEAANTIQELGVRLIINMIFHRPAEVYKRPPFRLLTLRSFDSIFLPIPLSKLRKGVKTALPVIQDGDSVLIYCRKGRHRSVAMASCILIGKGYSPDEAMALISSQREVADPYAWHIQRQIRRFEKSWNKR
jgi:protein tyrosine phosphatase (PTP) superfamily phosphohydrolase (DUF442 family)